MGFRILPHIVPIATLLSCQELTAPRMSPSMDPLIVAGDKLYTVIDLGTPGESFSRAIAINDAGQVLGWRLTENGEFHSFLWENGTTTNLGAFQATALNDQGHVTGWKENARAVLWKDGVLTELGELGGGRSRGNAINNQGAVVGFSRTVEGRNHAVMWRGGITIDLGTLSDGTLFSTSSQALDINAAGQVVGVSGTGAGNHAFLWEAGVMTDLGTLGGRESVAVRISDHGSAVGWGWLPDNRGTHAILWKAGHAMDLGTLGGEFSEARAINNLGAVIGNSSVETGEPHAFLMSNGVMEDLGTLGGPESAAVALNDKGQVVGVSSLSGAGGERHGFLWHHGVMTDLGTLGGPTSSPIMINNVGYVVGWSLTSGEFSEQRERAIMWRPLAEEEVLQEATELILSLIEGGESFPGVRSLLNKLKVATSLLNDGNVSAAIRMLEALANQVQALVDNGVCPVGVGQLLINALRVAIGQIR